MLRSDDPTVCRLVRLARERDERDRSRSGTGFYFDDKAANQAVEFFSILKHTKGEWANRRFALAPWQEFDIVRQLFGWKRADGTRRYRTAYVEIARKNGKSTLCAGIGNKLFLNDDEPGAEVYAAATKREQAKIVFGEARAQVRGMLRDDPVMRQVVHITNAIMEVPSRRAKFEPLGADSDTMDGLNVHAAIVDEIHRHKSPDTWEVLETATGARRQPLLFGITTAGFDRTSVCWKLHEHAVQVLEGFEDPSFFAYICTLDEGDDWCDESVWGKANPNLGNTVKLDDLRRKFIKARSSPTFENAFKRLHLNIWTEQATRFYAIDAWERAGPRAKLDELAGRPCFGGLDLAEKNDLAALTLIFPDDEGGFDVFCWAWLPEDSLAKKTAAERRLLAQFARQGHLELTEGDVIDFRLIKEEIASLHERLRIDELGYDPKSATQLTTQLHEECGIVCVEIPQVFARMSEPMNLSNKLLRTGKLRDGNNPFLRWQTANTAAQPSSFNPDMVRPHKAKSSGRIDNVVALIMALGCAIRNTGVGSVYDSDRAVVV